MLYYGFSYERPTGGLLKEIYRDGNWSLEYTDRRGRGTSLACSPPSHSSEEKLYLGHTLEEVLSSGRDILGEELTASGDPDYEALRGVMPRITEGAYCFLGGATSFCDLTVDTLGKVKAQPGGTEKDGATVFDPAFENAELLGLKPCQYLAGGRLPILFNLYRIGEELVELTYFVEANDTDTTPTLWIRDRRYKDGHPGKCRISYRVATLSHEFAEGGSSVEIGEVLFLDALTATVAYWVDFLAHGARLSLPVPELGRVAEGAMIATAVSFTGEWPHYGHGFYGKSLHDNFPPNYIWSIEAACVMGQDDWARDIFRHLMKYGLDEGGAFAYRQGRLLQGASATEYGMLIWLIGKYSATLMPYGVTAEYRQKLSGMGRILLSRTVPCPEFDGMMLVKMCAEADNNIRVNVYLNNNLWAIRGLEALCDMIGEEVDDEFTKTAKILRQNIGIMIKKYGVRDAELGAIVPFRFGYPAIPYTLSNCTTSLLPMEPEARERYFKTVSGRRDFDVTEQEITENTYANYRYYPEALSAMLLPQEYADGIYRMRATLGGNLLGMTRFRSWIDNWPVLNYARFLLETGRTEEYLLLLYTHTQHHGHPELLCYYEQIKPDGRVSANDCVPSLLTTPIMTAWAFAYESVDEGRLTLLSALPRDWYGRAFAVRKIGCPHGQLSITSDGERITVDTEFDIPEGTSIVWRATDELTVDRLACGSEYVDGICGNRILLKAGIRHAVISVK